MTRELARDLKWEGCFNVRDLGRLPTDNGGRTRWGAVVRADTLAGLTSVGWDAVGVRTVVDLRNDEESRADAAPRPKVVKTVHVPLDGTEDREFWKLWDSGPQFGTPLYYRPHLERFPERSAAVIAAIARAEPGGVVFHCAGGRDRTGQIAMLLLALVGVDAEDIADDYALSSERLQRRCVVRSEEDQGPVLEAFLADQGTTAREVIITTVAALDVEQCLRSGGLAGHDLAALRRRVLGTRPRPTTNGSRT